MFTIKKVKDRGFTIVELLIVIVVIGILATLVITTYNGIQEKARDTKRKTDINAVQTQVEAYQAQNGKYPFLASPGGMNDASFRSANLKGLAADALKDPKWSSSNTSCTTSGDVILQGSATPANGCYGYLASPSGCDNSATDCTGYTLTANLEAGGTYSKQNLN